MIQCRHDRYSPNFLNTVHTIGNTFFSYIHKNGMNIRFDILLIFKWQFNKYLHYPIANSLNSANITSQSERFKFDDSFFTATNPYRLVASPILHL